MSLKFLTFPKSGARADIRVRVRTRVVRVQRKHARDGAVVPVAATKQQPFSTRTPIAVASKCLYPSSYHASDFVIQSRPLLVLFEVYISHILCHPHL